MGVAVGIDLGTTKSAIACLDEHGRPAIIRNDIGEPTTPSVICFRGGRVIIGKEARNLYYMGEPYVAVAFKRYMGTSDYIFYTPKQSYTATQLSQFMLAKLKQDAETALHQPVTDAVISVPAYFHNPQREATIQAGKLAGFKVLQIINEPTAAAIAYGVKHTDKNLLLLVYDLGGGTFDVTLLHIENGQIHIISSEGDDRLGGKDWDERLIGYIVDKFKAEFGEDLYQNPEIAGELSIRAEEAKKSLSSLTSIEFPLSYRGKKRSYTLDRSILKNISTDLMERTISKCQMVLDRQRVAASDLDGILLVGGSTRMQMVSEYIVKSFGKPPMTGVNVDEAVALGAAIVANERVLLPDKKAKAGGLSIIDITNHSLGMIAINEDYSAYVNSIILPKNTPVPCGCSRPYRLATRPEGENSLDIYMTQGEKHSPSDVYYLGKYVLHDIPHEKNGESVIDVEYSYDISATVHVKGSVKSSGTPLKITIEPLPDDIPERFMVPPQKKLAVRHTTVYLAIDVSGSMCGEPMEQVRKAAKEFLDQINLEYFSMGLIVFSDKVLTKLEACSDAEIIEGAINELQEGETGFNNSGEPFTMAKRLFKASEDDRKILITLTDGVWCDLDENDAIKKARACHENSIEIVAIGFGGVDKRFLDKIASSEYESIFTSQDKLVGVFEHIAQELNKSTGGLRVTKNIPE